MTSLKTLTIRPSKKKSLIKQNTSQNKVCFHEATLGSELTTKLNNLRQNGELCDITIASESCNCKVEAHRLVLALKSPFFKKHFAMNQEVKEFKFSKAFSPESVEGIVGYLYEQDLNITEENVENYLRISVLLELPEITDTCSKFMATLLDLSNFSRFLAMANELDLLWLSDRIYLFLEWNFYDLIPMPCFLKMKSSQLHRVTCGRGLRLEREETLYNAVMRWYDFKPASRNSSLQALLQSVHFIRMSPAFLSQIYPKLVDALGLCKDKIKSAQTLQALSPDHHSIWVSGRRDHVRDVICLFSSNTNKVERFDDVQSTSVPYQQLTLPQHKDGGEIRCAVRVDKDLYVVSAQRVLRYNRDAHKWDELSAGSCVKDAGVCVGKGCILVVGGKDSKSVKRFDIKKRQWTELPPMETGRRGPGVVTHNNTLYVIGGFDTMTAKPLASVESLCLQTEQWCTLPPMHIPRCRLCCVTYQDKIYAMGGRDNVTSYVAVETFDMETNTWNAPKEHMINAREDFSAIVHDGMIVCIGGRGLQTMECYDPVAKGKWVEIGMTAGDKPKTGLSCVTYSPPFPDAGEVVAKT